MSKKSDRILEGVLAGIYASCFGACTAKFVSRMNSYNAQIESITQKVYSAAQQINPEVVEEAKQLISQFADKPPHLHHLAILGAVSGVLAIGYATRVANNDNYK